MDIENKPYDLLIVGGGINGAGIARDAAGRGLRVLLCEQGDLAGATSSASSKLIHGGLRYLEYYEFRLVRESLGEREVLLRMAPHIIWPLRFVLPHHKGLRPAWLLRLGLFLYDHLGGRKRLAGTRTLKLKSDPAGDPLKPLYDKAFEYSDCWVDDARLVVLNALDAAERGAKILTRTALTAAHRQGALWQGELTGPDGTTQTVTARALVNAAGPWVAEVLRRVGSPHAHKIPRLVKGSHIVVRKLFEGQQAYTCQNADGRVVFLIPYEQDFTLIGTTDIAFQGDPAHVCATPDEIAYLCTAASDYLKQPVTPADVVWTYAGVRPLYDDGEASASAVTRDYVFDLDAPDGQAPLLSIYGGKITTYRRLAEHALEDLAPLLHVTADPWTEAAPLPGGDIRGADFETWAQTLSQRYDWLPPQLLHRWARTYGRRIERLIGSARTLKDLGLCLGDHLYEAELKYLTTVEWARTAQDVLWRRSKLGLHTSAKTQTALSIWFDARQGN